MAEPTLSAETYNKLMPYLMSGGMEGLLLADEIRQQIGASAQKRAVADPTEAVFIKKTNEEIAGGTVVEPFQPGEDVWWIERDRKVRVVSIYLQEKGKDRGWYAEVEHYDKYTPGKMNGGGRIAFTFLRRMKP